jgi:hypothetical protein
MVTLAAQAPGSGATIPLPAKTQQSQAVAVVLALLDRAGGDPRDLLRRQRAQFGPLAAALADQVDATTGIEHALALWRHRAMSATMQFLDEAAREAELASAAGR